MPSPASGLRQSAGPAGTDDPAAGTDATGVWWLRAEATDGPGSRTTPVQALRCSVPALVGLTAAAAFTWWRGHPALAGVAAFLATALATTSLLWPPLAGRLRTTVERVGRGVGAVLTVLLIGLVWLVVVVPAAVFNRALGIDLLGGPSRGRWTPAAAKRGGRRTYGREPRPAGSGGQRMARFAIVVAGLVVISMQVADHATDVPPPPVTPFGVRSTSEPAGPIYHDTWATYSGVPVSRHLFPGEPWGADVLAFQGTAAPCGVPGDDGVATNLDVTSEYTNVADGHRRTLEVPGATRTVWMFGGSTTYGIGQRDEHTIASDLVRRADEAGVPLRVVNFGVCNELNWAETDRFEALLRSGESPPDAAIFLDGVNDWGNGFVREQFGLLDPDVPFTGYRTVEQQDRLLADARARGYVESHDAERQVELVATQYGAGVRRGRALGAEFGVPVLHFWQPALITTPVTAPGNPTVLANTDLDPASAQDAGRHYRAAMERSGADPVDLIDLFDAARQPVFFDCCHTNEYGARVLADAMYPHLERSLEGQGTRPDP